MWPLDDVKSTAHRLEDYQRFRIDLYIQHAWKHILDLPIPMPSETCTDQMLLQTECLKREAPSLLLLRRQSQEVLEASHCLGYEQGR